MKICLSLLFILSANIASAVPTDILRQASIDYEHTRLNGDRVNIRMNVGVNGFTIDGGDIVLRALSEAYERVGNYFYDSRVNGSSSIQDCVGKHANREMSPIGVNMPSDGKIVFAHAMTMLVSFASLQFHINAFDGEDNIFGRATIRAFNETRTDGIVNIYVNTDYLDNFDELVDTIIHETLHQAGWSHREKDGTFVWEASACMASNGSNGYIPFMLNGREIEK